MEENFHQLPKKNDSSMEENFHQQPKKNDSLNHPNLSPPQLINESTYNSPRSAENLREAILSLNPESEVTVFIDNLENNGSNIFFQDNDNGNVGGEGLDLELGLSFNDNDYEINSWLSTSEYDDMSSDVLVYYMNVSGLGGNELFDEGCNVDDEALGLGLSVGERNAIVGDGDEISPDRVNFDMYFGMGDRNEAGDEVRNTEDWGEDGSIDSVEEGDGWGSIERNLISDDNVLVFDFRGQGVVDLGPQVVVTVGGNGSKIGGRDINSWIPELVERVTTFSLGEGERERERWEWEWEWEGGNTHSWHVNCGWRHDEVDDDYYIGEYDMAYEDYLSEIGAYETPVTASAVEDLASLVITQENIENDHVTCAVCTEEFKAGEMTKVLPCSHYFHDECILRWLDSHHTCPICRRALPTDDPEFEGERNEITPPHE